MIKNTKITKDNNHQDIYETKHTVPDQSLNNENKNQDNSLKKKEQTKQFTFQVIHKKEIIPNITKNNQNFIKCIYCGSQYYNIHRFEAHIRIHVSL